MSLYAQLTAPDKLMHALSGVVLFAVLNLFMPGAYALLLTTFTGFMKEMYDRLENDLIAKLDAKVVVASTAAAAFHEMQAGGQRRHLPRS